MSFIGSLGLGWSLKLPSHETMEGWTKLQHGWQDAGRDVGTSRPKSQNRLLYCSSSAQRNCSRFTWGRLETQAFFSACHGKISQLTSGNEGIIYEDWSDTLEFPCMDFQGTSPWHDPQGCQFPGDMFVFSRGFDALHDDNCLLFHCGWLGYRTSCQRGREKKDEGPWCWRGWNTTTWISTGGRFLQKSTS